MKIGYARVSTQEQDLALQLDALTKEGCEKIFQEKASGAQRDRPELKAALSYMRKGDTLVVWKLDRLARSMKQLIETIESFQDEGIGLKSIQDPHRYQLTKRKTCLPYFRGTGRIRTGCNSRTDQCRLESREGARTGWWQASFPFNQGSSSSQSDVERSKYHSCRCSKPIKRGRFHFISSYSSRKKCKSGRRCEYMKI
jgi:Resolvase, N terminal domain